MDDHLAAISRHIDAFDREQGDLAELASLLVQARDILCPPGVAYPSLEWLRFLWGHCLAREWVDQLLHAAELLEDRNVEPPWSLDLVCQAVVVVEARRARHQGERGLERARRGA